MVVPLLEVKDVTKTFGGTRAVDGVSIAIAVGLVHALVGENGAGKSTLLRILGGIIRPDRGEIRLDGTPITFRGPADAQGNGVQIVHQELALLPELTVAENVMIGAVPTRPPGLLRRRDLSDHARQVLTRLGRHIDVNRRIEGLSTADQQIIEIARALTRNARVLILDEPTAALGTADTHRLLDLLRELAQTGVAIVYVSHRIGEVLRIADEVTVLKDGRLTAAAIPATGLSGDRLISLMVGRPIEDLFPPRNLQPDVTESDTFFSVEHVVLPPAVRDVSVVVRAGEILGIYGLDGQGQSEFLGCIGGRLRPTAGRIMLGGRLAPIGDARRLIRAGIGYLPPDRKREGLLLPASGIHNISLPIARGRLSRLGVVNRRTERIVTTDAAETARVTGNLGGAASSFSGGNQQKLLLARLIASNVAVLALDQPTRGVDVGAKAEIYRLIRDSCAKGVAAVVVSQEIAELIGLCDRIVVMRQGRLVGELLTNGIDEETVLKMAV